MLRLSIYAISYNCFLHWMVLVLFVLPVVLFSSVFFWFKVNLVRFVSKYKVT